MFLRVHIFLIRSSTAVNDCMSSGKLEYIIFHTATAHVRLPNSGMEKGNLLSGDKNGSSEHLKIKLYYSMT